MAGYLLLFALEKSVSNALTVNVSEHHVANLFSVQFIAGLNPEVLKQSPLWDI